ncbi:uncharacterized protein F4807DRAFT_455912 [Annulohypoxylon truncatum]|uniref:uncharacterized protein n=1 Tax=Annulohypoxylon truncatum TaxID=327061 RepID=UPI0020073CF0|nr:uncharacterized protein F4807DRAFT_455912 [Annulohypoxylon truncatum]KAI1214271.1 hypothetical protein F4807DRAFT_455912 [Annulohypoxylon truncatum]
MSNPRPDSPVFEFGDDGGRPKVNKYVTTSKFRVDDSVYVVEGTARDGPYKIEKVPYAGKHTLCYDNGQPAKNGAEFAEESLVAA